MSVHKFSQPIDFNVLLGCGRSLEQTIDKFQKIFLSKPKSVVREKLKQHGEDLRNHVETLDDDIKI
jgi:hypothetical protein